MADIRQMFINGSKVELPVWNGNPCYAVYWNGVCVWKNDEAVNYEFNTKWSITSSALTLEFPSVETTVNHKGKIRYNSTEYDYNSTEPVDIRFTTSGDKYVDIACNITELKDDLFNGRTNLLALELPVTVQTIGERAFRDCNRLTSVKVGVTYQGVIRLNDITEIKQYAFANCSMINTFLMNWTKVKIIGDYAFYKCFSRQTTVDLESVEEIGNWAFSYSNVSISPNLGLSKNLRYIGEGAFNGAIRIGTQSITIPNGVKNILRFTFSECDKLWSITFEDDGVETIGDYAFDNGINYDYNLKTINWGNSLKSIGKYAFGFRRGLTSIVFPDGLESIDDGAFTACHGLTYVEIPSSIKFISKWTFENCTELKKIVIHKNAGAIPDAPWSAGAYIPGTGTTDCEVIWVGEN